MFLWPKYESRLYAVDEELARRWADAVRSHGLTINANRRWARISNHFADYFWAEVSGDSGRVGVGVENTHDHPNWAKRIGLVPGVYIRIAFRVNKANSELAAIVARALFGAHAEWTDRSVRNLAGKSVSIRQSGARG